MTRRDLLRLMLASAVAEAVDFERLLWVPKPIVTVPAKPYVMGILRRGEMTFEINWKEVDRAAYDFWMSGPSGKLGDICLKGILFPRETRL